MKFSSNYNTRSQSLDFQCSSLELKEKIAKSLPINVVGKVEYALGYKNKIIQSELTERQSGQKALIEGLKLFDEQYKERMENYYDLKEENDNFISKFNQNKKFTHKSKSKIILNKLDQTFHDLFVKYKSKGYKIPDFSVNQNLFSPCPLLLDNYKIKDFYNVPKKSQIDTDKNINFLMKLNMLLNDKITTEEPDLETVKNKIRQKPSVLFQRMSRLDLNDEEKKPEINEIQNEIKKDLVYNERLRTKFIEDTSDNFSTYRNKSCLNIHTKEKESLSLERENSNDLILNTKTQVLLKNLNNENINNCKSRNVYQNYINKKKSQDSTLSINKIKTSLNGSTKIISSFMSNTNNQTITSQILIPNIKSTIYANTIAKKIKNQEDTDKLNKDNSEIEFEVTAINKTVNVEQPKDIRSVSLIPPIKHNKVAKLSNYNQKKLCSSHLKEFHHSSTIIPRGPELKILSKDKENSSFSKCVTKSNIKIPNTGTNRFSKVKGKENINNEREGFLNFYYEQINNHEYINIKEIFYSYAKKFLQHDDKNIEELLNKKIEPIHIMKLISELKSKVGMLNIPEKYKNITSAMGKIDYSSQSVSNIRELDKTINRLDYDLAKTLNKGNSKN